MKPGRWIVYAISAEHLLRAEEDWGLAIRYALHWHELTGVKCWVRARR